MSCAIFVQWTFFVDLKTFWMFKKIHNFWFKKFCVFWKIFINQIKTFNIACNLAILLNEILFKFQFFSLFLFDHSWLFFDWPIVFCGFCILGNMKQKLRQMFHFLFLTHLYKTSNQENCLFYINFWSKCCVLFWFWFFWLMNNEIWMTKHFSWFLKFAIFKFYVFIHEFFN